MIDKLLSKCGLVRKSRHNRIVSQTHRKAYAEGVKWARDAEVGWAALANKRVAAFRLEAAKATRQRDALQEALDRANRRLEDAGMISVTTFI